MHPAQRFVPRGLTCQTRASAHQCPSAGSLCSAPGEGSHEQGVNKISDVKLDVDQTFGGGEEDSVKSYQQVIRMTRG